MDRVLVTGATGLIGANVCKLLAERGAGVSALVRPGSEVEPLAELGVRLVEGDIRNGDDVRRAAEGVQAIVNSAALLGGRDQDAQDSYDTNYTGSIHCYEVGRDLRVVELETTTFFQHDTTLTERAPLLDEVNDDPYTTSKSAAYRDAVQRVADGQDIVFVIPGGTFGPSPVPGRALGSTSYNRTVRAALRGRIADFLSTPVPWVRAEDVASVVVAALEAGKTGDTYLAFGKEDAQPTAVMLNLACEVAGVDHRVATVVARPEDRDELEARYGSTVTALALRQWPVPWFDNRYTRETLGYDPVPLREALAETVAWFRRIGQIG